jgi:methylglyoxal synthase
MLTCGLVDVVVWFGTPLLAEPSDSVVTAVSSFVQAFKVEVDIHAGL